MWGAHLLEVCLQRWHHDHQDVETAFEAFKEHILPGVGRLKDRLSNLLQVVEDCRLQSESGSSQHKSIEYHNSVVNQVSSELEDARKRLLCLLKLAKVKRRPRKEEALCKKEKLLSGLTGIEEALRSSALKLEEPDPSLCKLTSELTTATVGEKITAVVQVFNFQGTPIAEPFECLCILEQVGCRSSVRLTLVSIHVT